ncbi:SDR family oxidoreductase [Gordonia McavH-238-E]|uniref:SDR family NAD(P)-dependent oxidoreductase n=1 Tax=Gordonia sp. McavH-238-E TaxID=2917736 RepID=UPI001EF42812|nr:SDR family oxidoreductase [Gordonia sp. McavH-238-E]MCG7631801.1 SDR family oxidoreductase [Gordonia sp. McavH-238-E]
MNNTLSFDFTGTSAIVTGGSSGIGYVTARLLCTAGANVTVTGTKPDASHYSVDMSDLTYRQLDLSDSEQIDSFAAEIDSVDVLINNAGANFAAREAMTAFPEFESAVRVNLLAPFRLTGALHDALQASQAAGGASVVMLTSMSAIRASTSVPGYGSAKAGIISLTQDLASAWASHEIRVNAVMPGVTETPMTAPMEHRPEHKQAQLAHIPMGRFATPEEIADAILFLCTRNAAYCTGTVLTVDGGYSTV